MAKKPLNGYTAWAAIVITSLLAVITGVVWAVRQEGKVNKNTADIVELRVDYKEDVKDIKDDLKYIKEKL